MNSRFLKTLLFSVLIFFIFSVMDKPIMAAPSRRVPVTVSQPSGQKIKAILNGDEKFNWWTDENGDVIVKGNDGYWYYANIVSGELQAAGSRYLINSKPLYTLKSQKILELKDEGKISISKSISTMSSAPLMGGLAGKSHKVLALLVEFPNIKIQNGETVWSNQFFSMSQDSVNKYYDEVSGGKFHFIPAEEASGIPNDGVVKVTLDYNHPNTNEDTGIINQWIVRDALTKANDFIDYSRYDTDKNGYISTDELHIVTVVAGYEASYFGDKFPSVWGHRWSFDYMYSLALDGVGLCNFQYGGGYTQQGEMHNDHMATIGILTHELAHDLGLPDLYDYDYDSLGVGIHSLMADGNWANTTGYDGSSPTHLDAWSKIQLGFVEPQTVTSKGDYQINSSSLGSTILKIPTIDSKQYFLVENRQFEGFDRGLASGVNQGGLAIWHIDDEILSKEYGVNDDENHKGVDLEEANEGILGYSQLDTERYWPKYDHYYYAGGISTFGPSTKPSSKLYDGRDTNIVVSAQSISSSSMKARIFFENAGPVIGGIDRPLEGEILNGDFEIKGWLLDSSGVNKIDVLVDNELVGQAIYGDLREDIAAKYPYYYNRNSGFHFVLDSKLLKDKEHEIEIRATGGSGMITSLPRVRFSSSNHAPSVLSTVPYNNEENIPVSNPVRVTFSEKVQRGDKFGQITITDASGEQISARPYLDSNGTLLLEPYITLKFDTVYTVKIPASAVKDMMNNPMALDYSFKFKTIPEDPNIIRFEDPNLLDVIRTALNKNNGDITRAEMESITYLDARGRGIRCLTGIEAAINLDTLYLQANQIEDITPLTGISKLRILELAMNYLVDISKIGALQNLEELHLGDNNIIDITPLKDLQKLRYITLFSNRVKDVSVFDDMPNLEVILIQDNNIEDITPITNKAGLRELSLSLGERTDLSDLANLVNLESLTFDGDYIKDISALSKLSRLESLSMWRTQVSDIAPIAGLAGLTWLNIDYSRLQDISPLENLYALEYLSLKGNRIKDISPLSKLLNIYNLELDSNEITDLTALIENVNRGGFKSRLRVDINLENNYLDVSQGSKAYDDIQFLIWNQVFVDYTPQRDPNAFSTIAVNPGDFPLDAPRNLTASVQFNRSINKGSSFNSITYKDFNGKSIEYTATITGDTLYIAPFNTLESGTKYLISIPSGAVVDGSGGSYNKVVEIYFGTADDLAPEVVSTFPTENYRYFPVDSSISIYFSENIFKGSTFDSITLKNSNGEIIPVNKKVDGDTVTLQPKSPLQEGRQYVVMIPQSSVMDEWGNALEEEYSFKFVTYGPNIVNVTGIRLSAASLKLGLNQEQTLSYTITPSNATNKDVEWSSSDNTVAVVVGEGNVRAVGKGTADITVKTVYEDFFAVCRVTVTPVESIVLNKTNLKVKAGYKTSVSAAVYPLSAVNKSIVWESSDERVAAVDSKGNITSIKDGTAVIYARSAENSNIFAQCIVTVETPVTGIKLDKTSLSLSNTEGYSTAQLHAFVSPLTANQFVDWVSSDENIVRVNADGVVTAVGPGKAVITAKGGSKTAKCTITVVPVTGVKLSKAQMSLDIGKYTILKPTITPSNAAIKAVTWEVTEGQSIIVTKYGKIIAVKEGVSILRVTTADGGYSFDCEINVTGQTKVLVNTLILTNIKTGKNIGMLLTGKSAFIKAAVTGENKKTPTNKNLVWSSSDENIAWVDDNGKVYGVAPGKVTVTAATTDGSNIEESVQVEIVQPVKSLIMEKTIYLQSNQKYEVKGLLQPIDITEEGIVVQWTISDKYGILVIDKNDEMTIDLKGNLITSVLQRDESGAPYAGLTLAPLKPGTVKLSLSIATKDGSKKTVTSTLVIQ